jgi:hypothetical protein
MKMSNDRISEFFQLALNEPTLREQLTFAKGCDDFVDQAVAIAHKHGYEFSGEALREALEIVQVVKSAA